MHFSIDHQPLAVEHEPHFIKNIDDSIYSQQQFNLLLLWYINGKSIAYESSLSGNYFLNRMVNSRYELRTVKYKMHAYQFKGRIYLTKKHVFSSERCIFRLSVYQGRLIGLPQSLNSSELTTKFIHRLIDKCCTTAINVAFAFDCNETHNNKINEQQSTKGNQTEKNQISQIVWLTQAERKQIIKYSDWYAKYVNTKLVRDTHKLRSREFKIENDIPMKEICLTFRVRTAQFNLVTEARMAFR